MMVECEVLYYFVFIKLPYRKDFKNMITTIQNWK